MLIINEKDIDNKKQTIKAMKNYYLHQMEIKKIPQRYKLSFEKSCDAMLDSLENIKKALIYILLLDEEKNGSLIKETKAKIENIILNSDKYKKDLVSNTRKFLLAA